MSAMIQPTHPIETCVTREVETTLLAVAALEQDCLIFAQAIRFGMNRARVANRVSSAVHRVLQAHDGAQRAFEGELGPRAPMVLALAAQVRACLETAWALYDQACCAQEARAQVSGIS